MEVGGYSNPKWGELNIFVIDLKDDMTFGFIFIGQEILQFDYNRILV